MARRQFYIPLLGGFVFSLFVFGVFLTPTADASSLTCANVRCAGTCLDTPTGPTCVPRVTCANTLCTADSRCEERVTGPVCVPIHIKPKPYVTPRPYVHPRPYVRPTPYVRPKPYIRPQPYVHPRPVKPYRPNCRTYRDSYRGYGYYRRDCAERPVYRPQRPRRPYYSGHGYVRPHPTRPPVTQPPVTPRPNDRICTAQYKPVCAQKQVQCVRAPCPAVKQTFSNACQAGNAGYSVLFNGVCNVR